MAEGIKTRMTQDENKDDVLEEGHLPDLRRKLHDVVVGNVCRRKGRRTLSRGVRVCLLLAVPLCKVNIELVLRYHMLVVVIAGVVICQ